MLVGDRWTVLSALSQDNSFTWELGTIELDLPSAPEGTPAPPALPVPPALRFAALPEIHHIFRTPDRRPATLVSTAFSLLALAPLLLLLGGVRGGERQGRRAAVGGSWPKGPLGSSHCDPEWDNVRHHWHLLTLLGLLCALVAVCGPWGELEGPADLWPASCLRYWLPWRPGTAAPHLHQLLAAGLSRLPHSHEALPMYWTSFWPICYGPGY